MQENDPLISVMEILAVMKLCGSLLTSTEVKMTCGKENRRCGCNPAACGLSCLFTGAAGV